MLLDELSRAGRYAAYAWESRPAPVGKNRFNLPRELLLDSQQLVEDQNLAHDAFLVNLFSVAALTWVLYDMTLNVDREISLVWKRWHEKRGRHSRRLYILVRYFSVINLAWYIGVNTSFGLSRNFCGAWYYIVLVNTSVITLLPDIMLLIRVNAVYNWDMRTLLFSIFLFIIQMTTSLVAGTLAVDSSTRFIPTGVIPGCQISLNKPIARFTLVAWIPSILIQFTYLLLIVNTLANLLHGLRQAQAKSQPSTTWLPDHTAPAPSNMPLKPITKSEPSPTSNQVDCDLDLNKALQATDTGNAETNPETPAVTNEEEVTKVASIPFPSSSTSPPIAFDTSTPGASSSKLPPRTRSISYQSQDMSFNTLRSTRTIQSSINDSSMRNLIQPSRSRAYSQSATEQSYLSSQSDIPIPSNQNQSEQSFKLHRIQPLPIPEPSVKKPFSRIPAPTFPKITLPTAISRSSSKARSHRTSQHAPSLKAQDNPFRSTLRKLRTRVKSRLRDLWFSLPIIGSTKMLFSWTALCQVKRLVPTMMVFVEHGGCYFSLAIMAKIANAIVVTTYSGPLQGAAIAWLMALYPVLVTRIYLSMVQYLNYGVPMKSERPRMFGSHDREYYGSGFIDEAEDGEDDDDDGEEGYARDIEFARGLRGDDWDGASEATFSFSADSPRASRSRRTSRVRRVSRPQRPGNRDDERRRRSRGPRLGRITFAARESLGSPSVIDFMDEEF